MPCSRSPGGCAIPACIAGDVLEGVPGLRGVCSRGAPGRGGAGIPVCTEADIPPSTAADGTHPTGMHSCCF